MGKIAIRDDDTSYWTDVDVLDRTVGRLWRAGAPVSLAIVPNAVKFKSPWDRRAFEQGWERKALGENKQLTDYLRDLIREGRVTPMLHGIDHRYAFREPNGAARAPVGRIADCPEYGAKRLLGEFFWKDPASVEYELKRWLEYLNDTLGYKIAIFVPPSNMISRKNARVVYAAGLDICGAIATRWFNRPASAAALKNYLTNACWRVLFRSHYPHALRYGPRLDRPAFAAPTPEDVTSLAALYSGKRRKTDLIIATHWFDYERRPSLAAEILQFIEQSGRETSPVETTFLGQ